MYKNIEMEALYCEITPEEANVIGRFEYKPNHLFDPFVGKQVSGNYLVSKGMYELLEKTEQFKKIDWTEKQFKEVKELSFEKTDLLIKEK